MVLNMLFQFQEVFFVVYFQILVVMVVVKVIVVGSDLINLVCFWCVSENVYNLDQINLVVYFFIGFVKGFVFEVGELWGGIVDFSGSVEE